MEPKNNPHLFKVPKVDIITHKNEFILSLCENKRVLHLGCASAGFTIDKLRNGSFLHTQIMQVAKKVIGIDIDQKGIELLKNKGIKNIFWGDVEKIDENDALKNKKFDVILAPEIIEHLNNPGLFLQSVKSLFCPDTIMLISTPNAFRLTEFSYNLKGYEYVHPDHNYWFSWKTLSLLLMKNGYSIQKTLVYSFVDHKRCVFAKSRMHPPKNNIMSGNQGSKDSPKNVIDKLYIKFNALVDITMRKILYKRNPFFADGIIMIVKLKEE